MRTIIVTLVMLAGLAAGCASSGHSQLYTLDMQPSAEAGAPVNLTVNRLRVAEPLQNKRILIQISPTRVEYYAAAEWAASLNELLAEKLAVEFGPVDPARETYVISGTLLAFGQIDTPNGADAHVRLAVEVRPEGASHYSKPELAKTYTVRQPADPPAAAGVVESLSAGLEQVARDIVADVSAL